VESGVFPDIAWLYGRSSIPLQKMQRGAEHAFLRSIGLSIHREENSWI
jgi:hypothetical protein